MNIVSMNVPLSDGKRGRVFARTQAGCEGAAVERLKEIFEEDDDKARWENLKVLLEDSHVIARVHPSSDHELRDIMQVYLFDAADRREEHPLFACTMVARSRVDEDLKSASEFLETSTLQVVDSDEPLSSSGDEARIKLGLLAWFDRVFPKCTPPREIEIKAYNDATACGWAYAQYSDSEEWYGPCKTREEAIDEGFEACTEERTFFVAPARWNKVDEGVDADYIVEHLLDHLGDNYGDFAQEAVEARLTPVARVELEEFLFRWQKKHLSQVYWTVDGAREEIVRATVPALTLVRPSSGPTMT